MDLPINHNPPTLMHVDLNSCFATIEQQANPLLRHKPIAVAAYTSPNGCILAPSYEAKRFGVKTGLTVREGKLLCPNLIVLSPDPPKYRAVHLQFRKIFQDYSPDVTPKSIDEAIIDFCHTPVLSKSNNSEETLTEIGREIKHRLKAEVGEWITCNIGISTNRFLAKTAASLHKPDGLDIITHCNLKETLKQLELLDLCGINSRYQARLNAANIFTPTQFFKAPLDLLKKVVFKSVSGYYWYLRLRGWEIDAVDFSRKSFGQSYAIKGAGNDPQELARLLMKLTEKMGRRLRRAGYAAQGIHIACVYIDYTHWQLGRTFPSQLYATSELYNKAQLVFNCQPTHKKISKLAVSCFNLTKTHEEQIHLFETDEVKRHRLSNALDLINDKYGEYIITPALMLGMDDLVLDRIAFGGMSEL